jgi:hypothetical protein
LPGVPNPIIPILPISPVIPVIPIIHGSGSGKPVSTGRHYKPPHVRKAVSHTVKPTVSHALKKLHSEALRRETKR